jgi:hypothetical protein
VAQEPPEPTYIAECFWPDVREEAVEEAAGRIREIATELTRAGTAVELTGTILVPDDEVVFYLFTGSGDAVREVCERVQVPFERVVEALELEHEPDHPKSEDER